MADSLLRELLKRAAGKPVMPKEASDVLHEGFAKPKSIMSFLVEKLANDPTAPRAAIERLNDMYGDNPDFPPTPFPFNPEPFVNNPRAQAALHKILVAAPEIRPRLGTVMVGPNAEFLQELDADTASKNKKRSNAPRFYPETLDQASLLGVTGMLSGNVGLNPSLLDPYRDPDRRSLEDVLAHELTHVAGYDDDRAYPIGERYAAALGKKKKR